MDNNVQSSFSDQGGERKDSIELALPLNPAYVSAARLTASSIASRMGFDIEFIEDIKTAVSEACTFLIKRNSPKSAGMFKIQFNLYHQFLEILLSCDDNSADSLNDEDTKMSVLMIKALMDNVEMNNKEDNQTKIVMVKKLAV